MTALGCEVEGVCGGVEWCSSALHISMVASAQLGQPRMDGGSWQLQLWVRHASMCSMHAQLTPLARLQRPTAWPWPDTLAAGLPGGMFLLFMMAHHSQGPDWSTIRP